MKSLPDTIGPRAKPSPAGLVLPGVPGKRLPSEVLLSLFLSVVPAGPAVGQQDTAASGAAYDPTAARAGAGQVDPNPHPDSDSKATPRRRSPSPRLPRNARRLWNGPRPRWVCPAPKITVGPIWHGRQIECSFKIYNKGHANLNIKACGG